MVTDDSTSAPAARGIRFVSSDPYAATLDAGAISVEVSLLGAVALIIEPAGPEKTRTLLLNADSALELAQTLIATAGMVRRESKGGR
jgi:hypothetical protein